MLAEALTGRQCCAQKREADWNFNFGEHADIAANVPWRVVTTDGIAHSDEDDGQLFGLSAPVQGEARTNDLLTGRSVVGVEVDEQTADLRVTFDDGSRLDLFNNSSGYEGWHATVHSGQDEVKIVALGGGQLWSNVR
jgi:hypothetical protein